ncbi:MAG: HAD family phosphatase [Anaerolineae bacterium]
MLQRFHNVIFDLDGLMCDTEPLYQRATNIVIQAAGADHEFQAEEYGRLMTGRSVLLNSEAMRERFALEASAQDLADAILAVFNVLISDANNIEPMPGLEKLLEFLTGQHIKLAVASGSQPEHVDKMLRALNLIHTFPVIAGSDASVKRKPAPDIYLHALQRLGASAGESLAIEDSLSGVRAARAAGIFVIAVKNDFTRTHDLSEADLVLQSLFEVKDYLSREG